MALLSAAPASAMIFDQVNPTGAFSFAIQAYAAPAGQEFIPNFSSVDTVTMVIMAALDTGATVTANLRAGTITGPILGSSAPVVLPPHLVSDPPVVAFRFPSVLDVAPGETYVVELVVLAGTVEIGVTQNVYSRGAAILGGQRTESTDMWFQEGLSSSLGHFVCYMTTPSPGVLRNALPQFIRRSGDVVIDEFASALPNDQHKLDLLKAASLCGPATPLGSTELLLEQEPHLKRYVVKSAATRPLQPAFARSNHVLANQFGATPLALVGVDSLLVPSSAAVGVGGAPPLPSPGVDHFKCYDARLNRAEAAAFARQTVTVGDFAQFFTVHLEQPTKLCAPANKNHEDASAPSHIGHLVCYRARLATRGAALAPTVMSTNDQFGADVVKTRFLEELCVPSVEIE